jgi:hypothetical protein
MNRILASPEYAAVRRFVPNACPAPLRAPFQELVAVSGDGATMSRGSSWRHLAEVMRFVGSLPFLLVTATLLMLVAFLLGN